MQHVPGQCEVWAEQVMIPTYGIGQPDKNPMFLEKRVYQGSSGKVYPLPVVDRILDEKKEQPYTAVYRDARVTLTAESRVIYDRTGTISPVQVLKATT